MITYGSVPSRKLHCGHVFTICVQHVDLVSVIICYEQELVVVGSNCKEEWSDIIWTSSSNLTLILFKHN